MIADQAGCPGADLLARDPVGATVPADEAARMLRAARADGLAVARALREAHPRAAPSAIASALGIALLWTEESPWAGPFLRFADYCVRSPEIRLFAQAFAEHGGDPERFVAHELYHHVEAMRGTPGLPRRYAQPRLRLGPWRLSAPVLALSEIAAGHCAGLLAGEDAAWDWTPGPSRISNGVRTTPSLAATPRASPG